MDFQVIACQSSELPLFWMRKLVFLGFRIPVQAYEVLFNKDVQSGIPGIKRSLKTDPWGIGPVAHPYFGQAYRNLPIGERSLEVIYISIGYQAIFK